MESAALLPVPLCLSPAARNAWAWDVVIHHRPLLLFVSKRAWGRSYWWRRHREELLNAGEEAMHTAALMYNPARSHWGTYAYSAIVRHQRKSTMRADLIARPYHGWELPRMLTRSLATIKQFDAPERSDDDVIRDHDETMAWVRDELAKLKPRHREAIEIRYFGEDIVSLEQTGRQLGVSKERARQLEAKAIATIRSQAEVLA
jgi:RNA polymerase sigma factor (sigma-70 family)